MLYPQSRRFVEAAALTPKVFEPGFDIEESRRQARELAAGLPREDVEQVLDVDADGGTPDMFRRSWRDGDALRDWLVLTAAAAVFATSDSTGSGCSRRYY